MNKKYVLKYDKNNTWYFENASIEYPKVYTLEYKPNIFPGPYEIDFNDNIKNTIHVFLMDDCIGYWNKNTSKYKPMFFIQSNLDNKVYFLYIVENAMNVEEAKNYIYNKNKNL